MSNARSPREVCSTTIGTSGLTVLASFRFEYSNPARHQGTAAPRLHATAGRRSPGQPGPFGQTARLPPSGTGGPELAGAGRLAGPGGPQLVARLGLLDRDR